MTTLLVGCIGMGGDSSDGKEFTYGTYEVDGGAVISGGLIKEFERNHYATILTNEDNTDRFDFTMFKDDEGETFVKEFDFSEGFLLVIQASALNSSMELVIDEIRQSSDSEKRLLVDAHVKDEPPYTDDQVITTLITRVWLEGEPVPDSAEVNLSYGENVVTFGTSE